MNNECSKSRLNNLPISTVIAPLLIIFVSQTSAHLFLPSFLKIIGLHQHFLSASISQTTRNFLLGILLGVGPFIAIFTTPILGHASDRWGRKMVLAFSIGLLLIGALLTVWGISILNFGLIIFAAAFSGFHVIRPIAKAALADEAQGNKLKLYFAWATLAMTLPKAVSILIGAFISNKSYSHWFSIQTPFFFDILILLFTLGIILFLFKEPCHHYKLKSVHISINPITNFTNVLREKRLINPLLAFMFFEFAYALFSSDIPLFLHEFLGENIMHMSYYIAFNTGFSGLSILLLYPLWIKWVPNKQQIWIPTIFVGVCYTLFAVFHTALGQWMITVPLAASAAIAYSLLMSMIASSVHEEKHGWALGIAYSVVQLVWFIALIVMSPLNELSPYLPLVIASVSALLSMAVLARGRASYRNA